MLKDTHKDETSQRLFDTLETSATRGAGIVRQVLTFARGMGDKRVLLQPRYLLGEIAKFIRETFPKSILLAVDPVVFGTPAPVADGHEAIERMLPYVGARLAEGVRLSSITRHMLGLYHAQSNGRFFRQILSDPRRIRDEGVNVIDEALAAVEPIEETEPLAVA